MKDQSSHRADILSEAEIMRNFDHEFTSWLDQAGLDFAENLDSEATLDPETLREILAEISPQSEGPTGGYDSGNISCSEPPNLDPSAPWSSLLSLYVESLNRSAVQGLSNDYVFTSYGFDEGHAGGCG
ncbi:hypothetical protein JL475_23595 [Streptomyces sp. M2CJ-2]|uniref:DUF6269 family protein n=1 Tax=Streptomyces sp. M2CJ-2 TaxID=2803948 RepID=UPI001928A862|nr:DUF6269 family protein [Streptomyces sp. M2CJ-2]MBL3668922.1 hypothetical protein [Streptomyces sp. M2CJ-2]